MSSVFIYTDGHGFPLKIEIVEDGWEVCDFCDGEGEIDGEDCPECDGEGIIPSDEFEVDDDE
jgi:DnaJ-class molecular chaperone